MINGSIDMESDLFKFIELLVFRLGRLNRNWFRGKIKKLVVVMLSCRCLFDI